jgi:hypothetical protein
MDENIGIVQEVRKYAKKIRSSAYPDLILEQRSVD